MRWLDFRYWNESSRGFADLAQAQNRRYLWFNISFYFNASKTGIFFGRKFGKSRLIVIFKPEMRYQIFVHHMPKRIFQLHKLNEKIMFRIKSRSRLRRFEIE